MDRFLEPFCLLPALIFCESAADWCFHNTGRRRRRSSYSERFSRAGMIRDVVSPVFEESILESFEWRAALSQWDVIDFEHRE